MIENINIYRILVGKTEGKTLLGSIRHALGGGFLNRP
jgi:hypothetical protein